MRLTADYSLSLCSTSHYVAVYTEPAESGQQIPSSECSVKQFSAFYGNSLFTSVVILNALIKNFDLSDCNEQYTVTEHKDIISPILIIQSFPIT
jgi:hypothetical protein